MKKRTPQVTRTRYYAGERVVVRSHQGTAACASIPCDGPHEFTTVIVAYGPGPGISSGGDAPDPGGRYLVISGGGYAKKLTSSGCLDEGLYAGFNVGNEYLGQLVVMIGAAAVLREAPPADSLDKLSGLFCTGPCKNFYPDATADSDPKSFGFKEKWWCRSCRQDDGWMRD